MKVDMKQLMGPESEPETKRPAKQNKRTGKLIKNMGVFALCLVMLGGFIVYQQMSLGDSASADTPYNESETNPSFVVQHVAAVEIPDIQEGEGKVPILKDEGTWTAALENGLLKTVKSQTELYKEYETNWNTANTLTEMSFLNGDDGKTAGYDLTEVWFGTNKESDNQSDFVVLSVPHTDGVADFSKVTFTNNPKHPGLSVSEGGYYKAGEDEKYVICIDNGAVIRLVFKPLTSLEDKPVNVYDYDVSDGGYYVNDDYNHKGTKQPTSRQANRQGNIYVNAVENGIHVKENYLGNGARLAFGGTSIGTVLGDEARDNELDTINVHNVMSTQTTGVSLGLTKGITIDGNIKWADNIAAPDLFGSSDVKGRTTYTNSQYNMTFTKEGFTRTLSSVKAGDNVVAKELEMVGKNFWIGDGVGSYGTDGHDPVWGAGQKNIKYYRSGDRSPKTFEASSDKRNHNSFFGLAYTEDFIISPGYTGPLDFFGYSDDDLWVYAAKVDKDGKAIEDTAVLITDLGGVHDGTGSYTNLWDVIKPVEYGKDAEQWRLFVYWLERDGSSAKCYLRFNLPEVAMINTGNETGSIEIEAVDLKPEAEENRTFVFDDGTGNKYPATIGDNTFTIISGEVFALQTGSKAVIKGLPEDGTYTVKETGKAHVWSAVSDDYKESDTVSGKVGKDSKLQFMSVENKGRITIGTNADGAPDDGYIFTLTLDDIGETGILAVDSKNNPVGYVQADKGKAFKIAIGAGDSLSLNNLPEGTGFSVTAEDVKGFRVAEILLDKDLNTSGYTVSGAVDASVTYRYESGNEVQNSIVPKVVMKQSVTGDWETGDVTVKDGTPISYNITVTNSENKPVDLVIEDIVPDGLDVMESTLTDSTTGVLSDGVIKWNVSLEANSSANFSFTGTVTGTDNTSFINSVRVLANDEVVTESNVVKAVVK